MLRIAPRLAQHPEKKLRATYRKPLGLMTIHYGFGGRQVNPLTALGASQVSSWSLNRISRRCDNLLIIVQIKDIAGKFISTLPARQSLPNNRASATGAGETALVGRH